jgi:hypothetical protein
MISTLIQVGLPRQKRKRSRNEGIISITSKGTSLKPMPITSEVSLVLQDGIWNLIWSNLLIE